MPYTQINHVLIKLLNGKVLCQELMNIQSNTYPTWDLRGSKAKENKEKDQVLLCQNVRLLYVNKYHL